MSRSNQSSRILGRQLYQYRPWLNRDLVRLGEVFAFSVRSRPDASLAAPSRVSNVCAMAIKKRSRSRRLPSPMCVAHRIAEPMRLPLAVAVSLLVSCNLLPIPEPAGGTKHTVPWAASTHPGPPRRRCPRFDETNVDVANANITNGPGSLRLDFANNKLYTIIFYPDHFDAYVAGLRFRGLRFDSGGTSEPAPGVRAWLSPAHVGR